ALLAEEDAGDHAFLAVEAFEHLAVELPDVLLHRVEGAGEGALGVACEVDARQLVGEVAELLLQPLRPPGEGVQPFEDLGRRRLGRGRGDRDARGLGRLVHHRLQRVVPPGELGHLAAQLAQLRLRAWEPFVGRQVELASGDREAEQDKDHGGHVTPRKAGCVSDDNHPRPGWRRPRRFSSKRPGISGPFGAGQPNRPPRSPPSTSAAPPATSPAISPATSPAASATMSPAMSPATWPAYPATALPKASTGAPVTYPAAFCTYPAASPAAPIAIPPAIPAAAAPPMRPAAAAPPWPRRP